MLNELYHLGQIAAVATCDNFGEHIPWNRNGGPEYVYNTPFTLATRIGGALLFVASAALVTMEMMPLSFIAVGIGGLLVAILGRVYASWQNHRDWIEVQATCLDREQRQLRVGQAKVWEYRLLCAFLHKGKKYTVTPKQTRMIGFRSEAALEEYLSQAFHSNSYWQIRKTHAMLLRQTFDRGLIGVAEIGLYTKKSLATCEGF